MKVRNGFVSNSSSSSFILIVNDKSVIDELNDMGPEGLYDKWYNDTLAEETSIPTENRIGYGGYEYDTMPNVPKDIKALVDEGRYFAYDVTIERNNRDRINALLDDERIVYYEFMGEY